MTNQSLFKSLILSTLFLSFSSYAVECNSPSPYLDIEGDSYYNIDEAKPLTREQRQILSKLFSARNNKLSGTGTITTCEGQETNSRKVFERENVKASISLSSDSQLSLSFDVYNKKTRLSSIESMGFFGPNSIHQLKDYTDNSSKDDTYDTSLGRLRK